VSLWRGCLDFYLYCGPTSSQFCVLFFLSQSHLYFWTFGISIPIHVHLEIRVLFHQLSQPLRISILDSSQHDLAPKPGEEKKEKKRKEKKKKEKEQKNGRI